VAADLVRGVLVIREDAPQHLRRDRSGRLVGEQVAGPAEPHVGSHGVLGVALVATHPLADVVVRVREVVVVVEVRDLHVGGAPLDVGDVPVTIREQVVVRRRPIRPDRLRHHLVEVTGPEHLEHLMRP
jgi:hypothetical protein